jgi:SNF2-related domain/Helicase conserved C-terminal domain
MISTQNLLQFLSQFQTMFDSALTVQSPRAQTPPEILLPLLPHQQAALAASVQLEHSMRSGLTVGNTTVYSKYGVLGDRAGCGKTLMALAHISEMKRAALPLTIALDTNSSPTFFSIQEQERPFTLYSSLIVVPHTLFQQWKHHIQTHTTLSHFAIATLSQLQQPTLFQQLESVECTLISNTLYPQLLQTLRNRDPELRWRRIFFDEADTIRIPPTTPSPPADFVWFMTSSFEQLFFSNFFIHSYTVRTALPTLPPEHLQAFHPQIRELLEQHSDTTQVSTVSYFKCQSYIYFQQFLKSSHPLRRLLLIHSTDDFIIESTGCQTPIHTRIECATAVSNSSAPSQQAIQLVESNQISEILSLYSIRAQPPTTLTHATQERIQSSIECPICYSDFQHPCVSLCCSQPFCMRCLFHAYRNAMICPLCRQHVSMQSLLYIGPERPLFTPRPTKIEEATRILRETKGKFILYSRYEHFLYSFTTLQLQEKQLSLRSVFLKGNKQAISNILKQFREGSIQILLVSSLSVIAGIQLPEASHCILFHRLSTNEKQHISGFARQIGRKTPFSILELVSTTS